MLSMPASWLMQQRRLGLLCRVRESLYLRRPATKDQSLQACFPCWDCVALEASMMSD